MTVSCAPHTEACGESGIGGKMKTLMLLVGLLMTWEHGQVLGAPAVSEQELQGE